MTAERKQDIITRLKPPKSYLYDYNRTTAPPDYNPTTEPPKPKIKRRYNTNKTSDADILKLREKINDENYLDNAIENLADNFTKGL